MADARGFFSELKRRNVLRAGVLYIGSVWALAQGIAQLGPPFGMPDWVTRWFVVACAIGFPFWLAFAWFYELTPQGLRRESGIEADDSIARSTGRRMDRAIIAVLAIAVVLLVTNTFVLRRDATSKARQADAETIAAQLAEAPGQSVAVLPFANLGGDPTQDYFSDGLSEELISDLTRIAGLKVVGRSSSFRMRDSKDSPAAIGARLGAAHLIEGSVRRSGNRFRVIVSLIRAADGSNLWSETFDRQLDDVFAVQGEISRAVAASLQLKVLGQPGDAGDRPPSGNVQAYEALMLGVAHAVRWTEPDIRKAITYYRRAIDLDRGYAVAWARLAMAYVNLAKQMPPAKREQSWIDDAQGALATARALAPELPSVLRARIYVMVSIDLDFAGALKEARRLMELAPGDPSNVMTLANQLMDNGRLEEALDLYRKTIALDPLNATTYGNMGRTLIALGRLDEAEQVARKVAEITPNPQRLARTLAWIRLLRGDAEPALQVARQDDDPDGRLWLEALAWHTRGDAGKADAALQEYLRRKNGDEDAYSVARIHAWRGEADEMFAWLDRARKQRELEATDILSDPILLPYKHDPRFAAYCLEVGLPLPAEGSAKAPASD
ncbi:MAG: tetratricopeptide repeat protein [Rhodanobacteraceae bacterium]